jgi:hypothetical protein
VPSRTGKQCRERYVNHLQPGAVVSQWTPVEDALLCLLHHRIGSRWAVMARVLTGRTHNNIKNRFHHIRRKLQKEARPCTGRNRSFHLDAPELAVESVLSSLEKKIPLPTICYNDAFELTTSAQVSICSRCSLLVPSQQTGDKICKKTGWCRSCVEAPPYLCTDLLRYVHEHRDALSFNKS